MEINALYKHIENTKTTKYIDLKEKFVGIGKQVQSFILSKIDASKYSGISVNHQTNLCNDCEFQDNPDDLEHDVKSFN